MADSRFSGFSPTEPWARQAPQNLTPIQIAFYRAGHAHAGVLTLLCLFLQVAVDFAALPKSVVWPVRIGAVAAALLVSGGFFAVAHA